MQAVTHKKTQEASLVLGLGATGVSCLRYLHGKRSLFACDDNLTEEIKTQLKAQFEKVNFVSVDECMHNSVVNEVIASPGISDEHPLVSAALERSIPVICDIEIYARNETKPVVAVTGTNGKSTVVSWLAHVLNAVGKSCALAGNIGVPALDIIDTEHECTVLELSSFQLERTMSLAPVAALILNVSSDHLDRYASELDYQQAKERVYNNAEMAIVNRDVEKYSIPASVTRSISFGHDESAAEFGVISAYNRRFLAFAGKPLLAIDKLPLIGEHNASNALAVLACAYSLGVEPKTAIDALCNFKGLAHRAQLVATVNNVRYINDSKATNAGATLAAVSGDIDNIILIAGGDAKNAELDSLRGAFKGKLKAAVLLGKDAGRLNEVLSSIAPIFIVDSIQDAVEKSFELSESGDTVLLSPACSSLDMFKNYIERGEVFTASVLGLTKEAML